MKRVHIQNVNSGIIGEVIVSRAANRSANSYLEDPVPLH